MSETLPPIVLTAAEIAQAMEGRLIRGAAARPIERFSIDSRTVQPGELFFAIHGERFDGHTFVEGALAAGAAGVVVSRVDSLGAATAMHDSAHDAPVVIVVDDTTRGLQRLARDVRRRSGARVIAITGSAGKTTTKEVTAALLALRYRTFRNRGNLNNHIGLPLSLLELRTSRPEMAVVELGMSAPGEIRTLVEIAEPDVRVWTNVGEAHLESFPSVDAIADAKAEILEHADANACLVINGGDPRVVARAGNFPGRVWTFGIEPLVADAPMSAAPKSEALMSKAGAPPARRVIATNVRDRGLDGTGATVVVQRPAPAASAAGSAVGARDVAAKDAGAAIEERVDLAIPLLGRANLANVLAGMAVALDAGVPLVDLAARARTLSPAPHRGEVTRLASGITVLDDAYNANPLAVKKALDVIAAEPRATRRIAVLGEMLELGPESTRLHEDCGRAAVAAHVDVLITVGGDPARALGEAAIAAGLPRTSVTHAADSSAAADVIATIVQSGDLVLVKGSRGIRLERVVERLTADRSPDPARGANG